MKRRCITYSVVLRARRQAPTVAGWRDFSRPRVVWGMRRGLLFPSPARILTVVSCCDDVPCLGRVPHAAAFHRVWRNGRCAAVQRQSREHTQGLHLHGAHHRRGRTTPAVHFWVLLQKTLKVVEQPSPPSLTPPCQPQPERWYCWKRQASEAFGCVACSLMCNDCIIATDERACSLLQMVRAASLVLLRLWQASIRQTRKPRQTAVWTSGGTGQMRLGATRRPSITSPAARNAASKDASS